MNEGHTEKGNDISAPFHSSMTNAEEKNKQLHDD